MPAIREEREFANRKGGGIERYLLFYFRRTMR